MSNINWKERAIERRIENKSFKKKIKELIGSRDNWKVKALARKTEVDQLRRQINDIKKNIQKIMSR